MNEDTVIDKPPVVTPTGHQEKQSGQHGDGATEAKAPAQATSVSGTAGDAADDSDITPPGEAVRGNSGTFRLRQPVLNTQIALNQRQEMTRIISNRLFVALFSLMALSMAGGYLTWSGHQLSAGATNWMVMLCGAIGGFISLQRRLKKLDDEDLLLLARSWVYVLLSPLVGGILALLLYFLFISGLLEGDLFPNFATSPSFDAVDAAATMSSPPRTGLSMLFQVHGIDYKDYAKLVFWCFLAGYSESFVTNIISQFESRSDNVG